MFDVVPYAYAVVEGSAPDAKQRVAAALAAGKPVIPADIESHLAVGYRDGGQTILIRSYWDGGRMTSELKEMPWGFCLFSDKRAARPEKDLVRESLQAGLENMKRMHEGAYATGWNAYRVWRKRLSDPWLETCTRDDQMGFCHANAYIYECLFDARTQAARYLRREAPLFGEDARRHLIQAAERYEKMAAGMDPPALAPYLGTLKPDVKWTKERRDAQIERLKALEKQDREAFAELAKALEAMSRESAS
ncbi:MAG TPA: hypothetical protein VGE01_03045 [Fimbriimonas sp.]